MRSTGTDGAVVSFFSATRKCAQMRDSLEHNSSPVCVISCSVTPVRQDAFGNVTAVPLIETVLLGFIGPAGGGWETFYYMLVTTPKLFRLCHFLIDSLLRGRRVF